MASLPRLPPLLRLPGERAPVNLRPRVHWAGSRWPRPRRRAGERLGQRRGRSGSDRPGGAGGDRRARGERSGRRVGWQIGARSFSQAYIFNTAEAVATFRKGRGFEIGVGLTAVAADFGAQGEVSSSTLQAPLVVVT
jgi:hypothetical protein